MHKAYQLIVDDGRGRFPEDLRVKAPRGARAAIATAAQLKHTSHSEYVRQALLRCLEADGVKLRRGLVELASRQTPNLCPVSLATQTVGPRVRATRPRWLSRNC